MSKGHRSQLKELPMAKVEQSEQQSKAVLGYNPKYRVNIHAAILIKYMIEQVHRQTDKGK